MAEVRKHKRQLASGRTANVRRHHRNTGSGGENPRPEPVFDPGQRAPSVDGDALQPAAAPPPRESWWDDDSQAPEGDWWAGDEPGEIIKVTCPRCRGYMADAGDSLYCPHCGVRPGPKRAGDTELPNLLSEMRHWRMRDIEVPPATPDTSPRGRALGADTQEGADKLARLKAYREAGYDGPLDSDNRIPDPDDPGNFELLHALAAMREPRG